MPLKSASSSFVAHSSPSPQRNLRLVVVPLLQEVPREAGAAAAWSWGRVWQEQMKWLILVDIIMVVEPWVHTDGCACNDGVRGLRV